MNGQLNGKENILLLINLPSIPTPTGLENRSNIPPWKFTLNPAVQQIQQLINS